MTSPRARSGSPAVVRRKPTPIALLLMDQAVVSGIGNVLPRGAAVPRARAEPAHARGRDVPEEIVRALWRDWVQLARHRRRDRPDDDDGRPRPGRRTAGRWRAATTGTGCTTARGCRAACAGRPIVAGGARRPASSTGAPSTRPEPLVGWSHAPESELRDDRRRRASPPHRPQPVDDSRQLRPTAASSRRTTPVPARRRPGRPDDRRPRRPARRPDPRPRRARAAGGRAGPARLHLARLVRRDPGVPTWNFVSAHLSWRPGSAHAPRRTCACSSKLVARFEGRMPRPGCSWERPNDPDFVDAAGEGHGGLPAHAHAVSSPSASSARTRAAEVVETIIAELQRRRGRVCGAASSRPRCARDQLDGAPAAARRDPRAARPSGRHRRRRGSSATGRPDPFGDAPVDVHLADGVVVDIAPAGALPRRGRARSHADGARLIPGPAGTTTSTSCSGRSSASARAARRDDLGRSTPPRSWRHASRCRTGAGSGPGSATRCGRTRPSLARPRCRDRRGADLPHQRRRAQRVAELRGAPREGFEPDGDRRPPRGRRRSRSRGGSTPWPPASPIRSSSAMARGAPRPEVWSGSSTSTWRGTRTRGRGVLAAGFDALRVAFGIYPEFLDRAVAEGLQHPATSRGARLRPRPGGSAQGDHRRLAGDPHGRVHPTPTPGDPHNHGVLHGRPRRPWSTLMPRATGARHRVRDPRDRRRRQLPGARRVSRRPARGARSSTRSWSAPRRHPRFARLGVGASVQPEHAMDDRDLTDAIWAEPDRSAVPLRSLADGGATLLFGSDAPVAPLDPWAAMAAAVFRTRDGRDAVAGPTSAWTPRPRSRASTRGRSAAPRRASSRATAPTSPSSQHDPLARPTSGAARNDGRRDARSPAASPTWRRPPPSVRGPAPVPVREGIGCRRRRARSRGWRHDPAALLRLAAALAVRRPAAPAVVDGRRRLVIARCRSSWSSCLLIAAGCGLVRPALPCRRTPPASGRSTSRAAAVPTSRRRASRPGAAVFELWTAQARAAAFVAAGPDPTLRLQRLLSRPDARRQAWRARARRRRPTALADPTTVHWHGMHLPAVMDGGPHSLIAAGASRGSPNGTIDQPAATLWYHPHLHGRTA